MASQPKLLVRQRALKPLSSSSLASLEQAHLQNLRHLIGGYSTTHCKMTDYASKTEDPEIKKLFQDAADSAMKNKQELMKFL